MNILIAIRNTNAQVIPIYLLHTTVTESVIVLIAICFTMDLFKISFIIMMFVNSSLCDGETFCERVQDLK